MLTKRYYPCFIASSLVTLTVLPTASFAQSANSRSIETMAKNVTVQISHSQGSGSAVLIGKEGNTYTILSAAHVLCKTEEDTKKKCVEPSDIELTAPDGGVFIAKEIVVFSSDVDLALIKFQSPFKYSLAQLGDSNKLKRGDQVHSSGFTDTYTWNFYDGKMVVNSPKKLSDLGHDLIHTALSIPGMSGGGVFNAQGELICINSYTWSDSSACVSTAFYREFNPQLEKTASESYILAQAEYRKEKYQNALDYVNQAIAKDEKFAEAYELRGDCYDKLSKYRAALKSYSQATALQSSVKAYLGKGRMERYIDDNTAALVSFQKAVDLDPKNIEAYQWLGYIENIQEHYDKSIKHFDRAIAIQPESVYSYYWRGDSYEKLGSVDKALESYNQAIVFNPRKTEAIEARVRINSEKQLYAEVVKDYDLLIENSPYPQAKIPYYWSRSTVLLKNSDYFQVLIDMDKIIEIDQDQRRAHLRKAETYAKMGDYLQAMAFYNRFIQQFSRPPAIARLPASPNSYSNQIAPRSSLYYDDYDSSNAAAYFGRGLVHREQRNYKQAIGDWRTAASLYRSAGNADKEQASLQMIQTVPVQNKS